MTLKHMAQNDFENSRTNTAIKLDERTLHESELQAFEKGDRGGARRLDHVCLQPDQPVGHRLRHLLVREQAAARLDRTRHVRLHGLGADRLRRRSSPQRSPERRRLGDAERQRGGDQGRAGPGQPHRPAGKRQRVRERCGLPRRRSRQRQDADAGGAERHERDPGERQLPADSRGERGRSGRRCSTAPSSTS